MTSRLALRPEVTQWSVPTSQLKAELAKRPLLVAMHGYGSNERDLAGLSSLLPSEFVVASVRAPLALMQSGYAWQDLGGQAQPEPGIFADPAEAVVDWLDGVESEYGSTGTSVSLLGFSQGAAMVSHLFRLYPKRFAAGVFLSGFLGAFALDSDAALAERKPPLFWGRDANDPIITAESVAFASTFLPAHFALTARTYTGVGHGISREEIAEVSDFLREASLPA